MILEQTSNLLECVVGTFRQEVGKIINENLDIFTSDVMNKIKVWEITDVAAFCGDLVIGKSSKVKYGRKQLVNHMKNYMVRWLNVPFKAEIIYSVNSESKKLQVEKLNLIINVSALNNEILENIYRFETFYLEKIRVDAHHEMGHIIDYIMTDGRDIDEYLKQCDEEDKLKDEYYEWKQSVLKGLREGEHSREEQIRAFKEITARYYQLPPEWRADTLGKVNRREWLDKAYNPIMKNQSVKIEALNEGEQT